MRKALSLALALALTVSLTACGPSQPSGNASTGSSSSAPVEEAKPLTEAEIQAMYTAPKDYIGSPVILVGQVFGEIERDEDGTYFQMYGKPEDMEQNTIVAVADKDLKIEDGDYIRLTGIVKDEFVGENLIGGEVHAPAVLGETVEILSYQEAVSPTLHTATAEPKTIEQYGYTVTVDKVELAETETRVYVKVENKGTSNFSMYDFNALATQDSKQIEQQSNFEADYPEIQTDLRPNMVSEGIICLGPMEAKPFQIILEGSSDNWDEDLKEFVFNCTVG